MLRPLNHSSKLGLSRLLAPTLMATALVGTGCASKGFVNRSLDTERQRVQEQISELSTQVELSQSSIAEAQAELGEHADQIDGLENTTAELSVTAREALERANEAGKLAEGRFVSETVLTHDALRFGFESSEITGDASEQLAELVSQLRENDERVYIEIQGHTDSTGPEQYNRLLGLQRAEAVREHLSKEHGVPLHRMAVISYGEQVALESNDTREGRSANRRVSIVVLK